MHELVLLDSDSSRHEVTIETLLAMGTNSSIVRAFILKKTPRRYILQLYMLQRRQLHSNKDHVSRISVTIQRL
ncbi:UNVERIFIED_CONTAM: hypothetical protein FKN15_032978 [Acipenser sinensis]